MAGASPVQTQEDLLPPAPAAIGYRLAGILLAPAVAVVVHVVITGPLGVDLQVPEAPGSSRLTDLSLLATTLVTLGVGLLGWFAVMGLERSLGSQRGRRLWVTLAVAVVVVSLILIAVLDVPTAARWGLVAIHVAGALVLIPALANGTPAAHPVAGGWVEAHAAAATAQEDTHAAHAPTGVTDPHTPTAMTDPHTAQDPHDPHAADAADAAH